jgi:hypothetical protein
MDIGSILNIASSLNSLTGGKLTSAIGLGQKSPTGAQAQQAADPFSPYRGAMGAQYAAAMAPGGTTDPTKMPGYSQWMSGVMQPAMSAVQGRDAAMGLSLSGAEQQDLMKVGQQGYYGFMTDYMNRLAQGSGAVNNPAPAAGMGLAQGNANSQGVMQGLGGLTQGLSQFGQPKGYTSTYQDGPGPGTGGYTDPSTGQGYNNPSQYQYSPPSDYIGGGP